MPEAGAAAIIGFSLSGIEAQCQETDTILEVARASGLNIPSACQFGVCGTCKIRKLKGEVHMVHNGGITDREIAQGYKIGRAWCRERVCQAVWISVVAGCRKKKR